jgi:hypothetical protein
MNIKIKHIFSDTCKIFKNFQRFIVSLALKVEINFSA